MTLFEIVFKFCSGGAETRRLIYNGGVLLNNVKIKDPDFKVPDGEHGLIIGQRFSTIVNVSNGQLKGENDDV